MILLLVAGTVNGQSEIDDKNKVLTKSLEHLGINNLWSNPTLLIPDSISNIHVINGKYFYLQNNTNLSQYAYIGRVNSCRGGGCSSSNNPINNTYSEYFDYFILFDQNKNVQTVKVFNYQATHGQEITAKGWLKQFIGYDGKRPLQVNKDVDTISGATISVYAITADIETKTKVLQAL